ncbi:MAG: PP0621 family protein [Campylobacterota bacterium]|nr:PP0621 family protein [Campylobacterota bacterium]
MILKILLVLGVIAVVYFLFIKKKPLKNTKKKNDTNQESNDMVECASCGTYASVDDCIISDNKYYCCSECVDKK